MFLRQSTSQTIRFGPFLDDTDFKTAETALTIAQADRQISKDGAAFAQSNHTGNSTHDTDGWYSDDLDATDTNTVGELILQIVVSGALPVWVRYWVIEEDIYDALFGASAAGFDSNQRMDVGSWIGTAVTLGNGAPDVNIQSTDDIDLSITQKASVNAEADTALADYNGPTHAELISEINDVQTDIAALNNLSTADIDARLAAINLDHLCAVATVGPDMTAEVVDNSIISRILSNGDTSAFVPSTDGLQPIRDHIGDGSNLTEAGGDGDHLTGITGAKLAADGVDLVLVDGKTLPAALQIIAAVVAGKISGAGTGTEVFVGIDDSTNRVTVTVDASGNRTAVTYV